MAADRSKARAAIDDPLWAKILLVGTVLVFLALVLILWSRFWSMSWPWS